MEGKQEKEVGKEEEKGKECERESMRKKERKRVRVLLNRSSVFDLVFSRG